MTHAPTEEPLKVGYITGVSYCGSTLLALVLNTHPRILSIGEISPAAKYEQDGYECSCGSEITRCEFFCEVRDRMADRGVPFDLRRMNLRHRYSDSPFWNRLMTASLPIPGLDGVRDSIRDRIPRYRSRIDAFRRSNEAFIRAALETAGKSVFLDATKHAQRFLLFRQPGIDLRVIHLVRDPRGYCNSTRKHNNTDAAVAAQEWVNGHRQIERHLRALPSSHWTRIAYEDFCRDPGERLSEIATFLGAGPFELQDDFWTQPHHILGNEMRRSSQRRSKIRLDEAWREKLRPEDLRAVESVAGDVARRYGYDI